MRAHSGKRNREFSMEEFKILRDKKRNSILLSLFMPTKSEWSLAWKSC